MFKDIIETVVKELQNEKNLEHLDTIIGPLLYRIKSSYYIIIILLILVVGNLVYSNILLSEMIKGSKKGPFNP
jgi:hypothetical protein